MRLESCCSICLIKPAILFSLICLDCCLMLLQLTSGCMRSSISTDTSTVSESNSICSSIVATFGFAGSKIHPLSNVYSSRKTHGSSPFAATTLNSTSSYNMPPYSTLSLTMGHPSMYFSAGLMNEICSSRVMLKILKNASSTLLQRIIFSPVLMKLKLYS